MNPPPFRPVLRDYRPFLALSSSLYLGKERPPNNRFDSLPRVPLSDGPCKLSPVSTNTESVYRMLRIVALFSCPRRRRRSDPVVNPYI